MEQRYLSVSKQLVELGYKYTLNPDSLLLVERLLGDLIETTENLRKYMKIAQDAVEERDNLKFGAEPYKCDNAKLVKECNELHLAFLQVKEQNEKQQKELTKKVTALEREKREFIDIQKKLRERVREFELDAVRKTDRQFQNQLRQSGQPKSTSVLTKSSKKDNFEISSAMALADQKIANLMKEVNKLKENQLNLTETNCDLKNKLNTREKEIQRLMSMLEGGRPVGALNNDCCYQDMNVKLLNKQDEIVYLQKAKSDLESKLKEARCKQHEAMKHALSLAERNTVLEKELRDIDEMALAVEQECNTTVKNNSQKVKRLQERMHNTMLELQRLETEVSSLRRDKQCLVADLDAVKIEKRHLQTVLENTLEDKKHLSDKINKFTIIERDLNNEIDRLVKATAEQKRTLAELKGHVLSGNYDPPGRDYGMMKPCTCQGTDTAPLEPLQPAMLSSKKSPPSPRKSSARKSAAKSSDSNKKKTYDVDTIDTSRTSYKSMPPVCDPEVCMKKLKEMVDEEMSKRYPSKTDSLERLKNERDFYIKEYQQLMEQFRNMHSKSDDTCSLLKKLNEKEDLIINLQYENDALSKEKHNLMCRLENVRDYNDDGDSLTMKSSLKRLERERDLLKADIERMEEERDSMKQRIKVASELHSSEIERYQKSIADLEGQLKKYEKERHDLIQNQGSRRATITTLEDQCETLKEQLKSTQGELTHHRTIYSQLKILHEQTDRALADSQGQLMQLEKQLANHQQKNNMHDSNTSTLNKEIINLKNDMAVLKQTLTEVEMDNDSLLIKLDEKTERIATLEAELQQKDAKVNQLELTLCELKNRVSSTVEEKNTKEFLLKNTTCEMQSMKNELQCALKAKETALCENRRLQEDLAACTSDCRRANGELEIAKRQIEDLKRQLQHYVAEVKRIEDLMTQKEVERSEMLDQFRNLSHEAVALENNNHSLENEATQSKVQLSVALDHASDLERQLDERNCVIKTYERQISEMSCQIANFEMQIKHYKMQLERTESDLASVQDLCVKLDKQKEDIQRQLCDQEGVKMQAERDIQKFKRDSESLRKNVQKDHETVENLEHLLAENRQQVVEQRLLNDDLQGEVVRLKSQIKDLECNLASTTERLDVYQEKALEYSQQNKQLRRDLTNERFLQSKEDDFHRKCGMRNRMQHIDCKIDVKKSCDCKEGCASGSKCICDHFSTKTLQRSVCNEPPKSCLNKGTFNRNKSDVWQIDDYCSKSDGNKTCSPSTSHCRESPVKSSIADTVNRILEKNKAKDYDCCNKENYPDWRSVRSASRSPTHSIISNRFSLDDDRNRRYSPRGQSSSYSVNLKQNNCACMDDDCGCRKTSFQNKY